MADIRNDQYLHRPGAGRGAVTPTDPMEVRIFDGAGNPVAPATEGKQDQILSALGNLENTVGTEATLAAVKSVLDSLSEYLNMRLNANLSTLATNASLNMVRDYIGSTGDAAASAGGTGSVSAKLRRLTADLADVLARLNTDLSTRASEQTLVQARDALSALAGTVDAGTQKVTLTGRTNANDPIAARLTDGTNYIGISNPLPIREPAPTAIIRQNPGGMFAAGATVTVFSDVDVSAYRQVWAVAQATANVNYTIAIRRVGYNSSGSTGIADRGIVVSKDSGNTSSVSTGVVYPEAPRVSVTLRNPGASPIYVDVALGGVR